MTDNWKQEYQRRQEDEQVRLLRPATAGDIEKLVKEMRTGWVGRGFAIGIGIWLCGLAAGLLTAPLWLWILN